VRGTSSRTADEFETELNRRGATLNASAGREFATISLGLASRDFEAGLELLADAVLNPAFPEDEIDAARARLLQQIASGRQNAGTIADEHAIGMALEGAAGHPVAGTLETLTELHRAEVQAFHRRCYRPDRALLAVAGCSKRAVPLEDAPSILSYGGDRDLARRAAAVLSEPPDSL